jgi:hypothetical protein
MVACRSDTSRADKSSAVRQIIVPPEARTLSTLSHIEYADAFLVDVGTVQERTAEQWAQAFLEDAPARVRHGLLTGWTALGLKLGRTSTGGSVLGWQIRRSTPEFVLLGAGSRIGMAAELLVKRTADAVVFCTFVQQDNQVARSVWTGIEPAHVSIVRRLLERASRRCRP